MEEHQVRIQRDRHGQFVTLPPELELPGHRARMRREEDGKLVIEPIREKKRKSD